MSSRRATNGRPLLTRTRHKYIIRKRHTTEVGGPALIHDRSAVRAEHHAGEHSGFSRFCRMTARPPCRSRGVRDCLYPDRVSAVSLPRRDNGAAQNVIDLFLVAKREQRSVRAKSLSAALFRICLFGHVSRSLLAAPEEGHDLRSGAIRVGAECRAGGSFGDILPDRPQYSVCIVGSGVHIGKGISCTRCR